jgi:hypothetical protein
MQSHAIVYYTHNASDIRNTELRRLRSEIPPSIDIWAIGCCSNINDLSAINNVGIQIAPYMREDLVKLPYKAKMSNSNIKTLRGCTDLPILQFFRDHPNYDHYWIVEYDVRFSGGWDFLFDDLLKSDADLLCTHLASYRSSPGWMHWRTFESGGETVPDDEKIRCFLPFCRLSNKLLRQIDSHYSRNWSGHFEALWPTIARLTGCKIEEIGGEGVYVPASRKGKYYYSHFISNLVFLSTFNAWPYYSNASRFESSSFPPNTLWHPVKD